MKKIPILVGIAGGSCAGKTEVCEAITQKLETHGIKVQLISFSNFYRKWSKEEQILIENGRFNFDHPDSIDFDLLFNVLNDIKSGHKAKIPVYDLIKRQRKDLEQTSTVIDDCDVVLIEGSLLFYPKKIRNLLNVKIFVDEDSDVRLSKRVLRDTEKFNRKIDDVLQEYVRFVKPSFEEFILPTKKTADLIVPKATLNIVAIDMIAQHLINLCNNGGGQREYGLTLQTSKVLSDMLYSSTPSLPLVSPEAIADQESVVYETIKQ